MGGMVAYAMLIGRDFATYLICLPD